MFRFPPQPQYPNAIDSDYTLFLVYNTTQARLASDNEAWSSELAIVPVAPNALEIWANNGFGNINGELFYYDSVNKNSNGKVDTLTRVARNLGGTKTQFNNAGTWVRGFVVAEHHNQLVDAVIDLEGFIGENFAPDVATLDYRIRHLQALNIIFDDFSCPNVDFNFSIASSDPATGILTNYQIIVDANSTFTSFRLDFGDGTFTTNTFAGQHLYAANAQIDPVLTIGNNNCQTVVTPAQRTNTTAPTPPASVEVTIPIPTTITFPEFTLIPCTVPEQQINIPNIVLPCVGTEGQLPSIIIGPDINLVSNVSITGLNFPIIMVSQISIAGLDFPIIMVSNVTITSNLPSIIVVDSTIPSIIHVITTSFIGIDWGISPEVAVDWGENPKVNLEIALTQPVQAVHKTSKIDPALRAEFGDEFAALFDDETVVEYEPVGIPSEIRLIAPSKEDLVIKHELPEKIKLEVADNFPTSIVFDVPAGFGKDINIIAPEIPDINIVGISVITVEHDLPSVIKHEGINFPDKIVLDASSLPSYLEVRGVPSSIDLKGMELIPSFIQLLAPEGGIDLVYRGGPIEMKLTVDNPLFGKDENGKPKYPVFMHVPYGTT